MKILLFSFLMHNYKIKPRVKQVRWIPIRPYNPFSFGLLKSNPILICITCDTLCSIARLKLYLSCLVVLGKALCIYDFFFKILEQFTMNVILMLYQEVLNKIFIMSGVHLLRGLQVVKAWVIFIINQILITGNRINKIV